MMETDKNIQSLGVKYLAWLLTNIPGRSPRLAPNIARFGFVSVVSLPISLFIPHHSWTLDWATDCRWSRIGIHLNLHPYQQRLDRISFVYSDLARHMVVGGMFSSNCHQELNTN